MLFSNKPTKKAIAYYRHSAEDKQENSIPIQQEHIQKYAAKFQIQVIHEEADAGKSGLTADRPGYQRIFSDWITRPDAPHFDYILVYDVSRWGRYQNHNEAAYYEHLCNQKGVKVVFVQRGLPPDEQHPYGAFQTTIERHMAADYSKQLSEKVFYGCAKVSEQGYSAGGTACYGMARLLLDANKNPKQILKKGEHKAIDNERVTFTPLNDGSTQAVKDMFDLLVKGWHNPGAIADVLNTKAIPSASGGLWNREKVTRVLTNETYIGTRIYNKTWGRLKQPGRSNPRSDWVIRKDAFPAVVDPELFRQAQERLYWLLPSQWKKGVYTISKVKRLVKQEIKTLLAKQGGFSEEQIEKLSAEMPIVFSINFYRDGVPHWCFLINEAMRSYEFVFGISIFLDQRDLVDRFFLIPTSAFSKTNFMIFSEQENFYADFKVEKEKIEEEVLLLGKQAASKLEIALA